MQSYDEKRHFPRMAVNSRARYWLNGSDESAIAIVENLSGSGVLLYVDKDIPAGSEITVEIKPQLDVTPPRTLVAEVVRCDRQSPQQQGEYSIACDNLRFVERDAPL